MKKVKMCLLILGLFVKASYASSLSLEDYVGYTIIASWGVEGYINEYGKFESGFEGCDHDRVIVFENNKSLVCENYNYDYSNDKAVILYNGYRYIMIVDDESYEMKLR